MKNLKEFKLTVKEQSNVKGGTINIPAKKVIKFKAGSELADSVQ
ncbi:hypothetical protein [Marinifilum sp.]